MMREGAKPTSAAASIWKGSERAAMDDRAFDELSKRLGTWNRRKFLKGLAAAGGAAVAGRFALGDANAARRGYSGPIDSSLPANGDYCGGGCCIDCGGQSVGPTWLVNGQLALCMQSGCPSENGNCCDICAYRVSQGVCHVS